MIKRLAKIALALSRRRLSGFSTNLGVEAEDVAQTAIMQFLQGWTPDVCKPEAYIAMCVRREISDRYEKSSRAGITYDDPENVVRLTSRQTALKQDEAHDYEERCEELLAFIAEHHKDASSLARCILDHDCKITRRDAAQHLKISLNQYDHLRKKLKVILRAFLDEAANAESPAKRLLSQINGDRQ